MTLYVGDVVSVRVRVYGLWWDHFGIVSGNDWYGQAMVINKSMRKGGVVDETLDDFLEGGDCHVHPDLRGVLPAEVVVERARRRLREAWAPAANCEHFVREAHGLPSESPQLQETLVLGGGTLVGLVGIGFLTPAVAAGAAALLGIGAARRR